MWLVICVGLGIVLGGAAQQKRVVSAQKRCREQRKVQDDRIKRLKSGAIEELRNEHARYQRDVEALRVAGAESRREAADRERELTERLVELATRPPVVQSAAPTPDFAAIIESVGKSVASVAYGPDRPPLTTEQQNALTFDITRNLDAETLGAPSGDWMPDVEMDEWMEEHGVPNHPGWVAGAGIPMMQASPDLPPGMMAAPRPNGDTAMFQSGHGAPPPQGGVE